MPSRRNYRRPEVKAPEPGLAARGPRSGTKAGEGASDSATVVASGVGFRHGTATVLKSVSLTVSPASRIGIVGPNGIGKTTLLRILAGLEAPETGSVVRLPPSATVGYLAQERTARKGETVARLLTRRTGVAEAEAALERAASRLGSSGSEPTPELSEAYAAALERYLSLGGPDLELRTAEVFARLGIAEGLLDLHVASLSGGQAARVALAALLLSRFGVVLLDEPTNDLDFEGLDRLEEYLEERRGGLVVVSHDRAFLQRIVTSVAEIDEGTRQLSLFAGGWSAYLEARDVARRHAEEEFAAYSSERDRLKARERQQRQWATTGVAKAKAKRNPKDNDKAQRDFRINRTEKQASKVRSTERALERLEPAEKPFEPWKLQFDLASTTRSGDVVARLSGATAERGTWSLGPVDLEIGFGERVAILGPNGSGKTTLLKMLLGTVPLASGDRWMGPGVVAGVLGQTRSRLDSSTVLLDGFLKESGWTTSSARSLLAKFGLGAGDVGRSLATLSPGERTRAELALFMAIGANCLVLDEPTNHLDLPAIEQLEEALERWTGTLLLVTHDRRLLETVSITRRIELPLGSSLVA